MGNFSRNTFDRLKHYVGVRLQQGVPLIDADWNEQEDIRKFELQAFLKWFAGNGVPSGNDGFLIMAAAGTTNNFDIKGGDGTALGAGRILVEGLDAMLESTLRYTSQPLYNNATLAAKWGVAPIAPLTTPGAARIDLVYIDVWEREVDSTEDSNLINPAIGIESCVRLRREWAVRVAQGASSLPSPPAGHGYYALASIKRPAGNAAILSEQIADLRTVGINLSALAAEIIDARGMKGNLGNRLDESLTKGGQLRFNVVGSAQLNPELTGRVVTIENHLTRTDNPHNVTAAQAGALAAVNYDFTNRVSASVVFSNYDANNATRNITTGFRSRFVWIVGSARAQLGGQYYGANVSAYADLRSTSLIQQCTGSEIILIAANNWRQNTSANPYICKATFTDQTALPQRTDDLNVVISGISNTTLTVRFSRILPGTGTGTGGTGGTGTSGTASLTNFRIELRLLCLG
ncbi:MAG: hypothetical protein KKC76_06170 [Proteobacteria bacterium]|nr:hypothetical protein [Pseudomonadota bacterium]MBU4297606.1 hypothetical protein [Pseudomonadota bacterium]MCG2750031.1 DUF6519 domain-containing protein [Desulfobulbaceae bacterium]